MKRRDFLRNSVFIPALGITLAYSLSSCSSDDSTEGTTGTDPAGTCTSTSISVDLHTHSVEQPDLTSTADVTLAMGGSHTHTVMLTAADLANLSMCGTVKNTSEEDGSHLHQVTFTAIS